MKLRFVGHCTRDGSEHTAHVAVENILHTWR